MLKRFFLSFVLAFSFLSFAFPSLPVVYSQNQKEVRLLKFKNNRLNDFFGQDRVDGNILAMDAYTVEMPFVFAGPLVKEKAK